MSLQKLPPLEGWSLFAYLAEADQIRSLQVSTAELRAYSFTESLVRI